MVMHFRNLTDNDALGGNVKTVFSCCAGEVIPLERLSNDVFSSMILGDGFGVIPSSGKFTSPAAGTVKDVSESGCDVTIKTDDDIILIVSIGYDASDERLRAECNVRPGDHVTVSSVLWNITQKKKKNITAAVIVTNSLTSPSFNIRYGVIKQADTPVMTILL